MILAIFIALIVMVFSFYQALGIQFSDTGVYTFSEGVTVGRSMKYDFAPTLIPLLETGSSAPYSFYLGSGVGFPPMGLKLDMNGVLKGTPTGTGDSKFEVCVKDVGGRSACRTYSMSVSPKSTTTSKTSKPSTPVSTPTSNTSPANSNLNTNSATNNNNNEQISPSIKIESAKATLERSEENGDTVCTVELSGTATGPTCGSVDVLQYGYLFLDLKDRENAGSLMYPLLCSDWTSDGQWCTRRPSVSHGSATTKWSVTMKGILFPGSKGKGKLFSAELDIPKLPLPLTSDGYPNCFDSERANQIVDSIIIPTCN